MSITEDIFSNNIMGSIIVYDTQDIRTILPITGLERLSFKLNTLVYQVMICQRKLVYHFKYIKLIVLEKMNKVMLVNFIKYIFVH